MNEYLMAVLAGVGALIVGVAVTATVLRGAVTRKAEEKLKQAEAEGEALKKEKMLQAKEKFLQLKQEHEKAVNERNNQAQRSRARKAPQRP
jgi:ribonuclease Y